MKSNNLTNVEALEAPLAQAYLDAVRANIESINRFLGKLHNFKVTNIAHLEILEGKASGKELGTVELF